MNKTSGRQITFELTVTGTTSKNKVFKWDQNQQLEGTCHAGADLLNEGTPSQRKTWDDRGKNGPPDHTRERQQQEQQTT